jgi:hypothetical protein
LAYFRRDGACLTWGVGMVNVSRIWHTN